MKALRVDAELELSVDGITLEATGDDGVLVMTTPSSLPIAHRLRRVAGPRLRLPAIAAQLVDAGVTVRLDSGAGPLLFLGAGVESTPLVRVLGWKYLRTGSLVVLWRHSRATQMIPISSFLVLAAVAARRRRTRGSARPGSCSS